MMLSNFFKAKFNAQQKKHAPIPKAVWRDPRYFIAFGLGSGTLPFAPGTFGTLMAIPFYLALASLSLSHYLIFVLFFIIASSWLSHQLSQETDTHDHPGMCIDEFAGFFVTMINVPMGFWWIFAGFLLFRFFDIVKPWPIHWFDNHVHGGFGMVLDDVVAGLMSCAILNIAAFFVY